MYILDFQSYLFGLILYIAWIVSLVVLQANLLIVNLTFGSISILNSIFYLTNKKTRQLFYSNASVLSRSPHVHRRNIAAGSGRGFRSIMADKLRSMANEQRKSNINRSLEAFEIDIWDENSVSEGIFIFLFPTSILFSFLNENQFNTIYFSLFQSIVVLILIRFVHLAIIDQKIIGEELYRTADHSLQPKVVQTSVYDYAVRVKKRTANYRNNMPRYGPGADLENILPNPHLGDNMSDYEYSDNDSSNRSPSFFSQLKNSSLLRDD